MLYYSYKIGMVNRSNENAPSLSVAVRTNIHTYHTTKESDMPYPNVFIQPDKFHAYEGYVGEKSLDADGLAKSLSKKGKK